MRWDCSCRFECYVAYCLLSAFGWCGRMVPANSDEGWGVIHG